MPQFFNSLLRGLILRTCASIVEQYYNIVILKCFSTFITLVNPLENSEPVGSGRVLETTRE